ncbi:MAG: histidinol dehydrogenase [Magnetococcales bacterium]|nr:histidinol dehydrogenase [Magnetococcales bacterium]
MMNPILIPRLDTRSGDFEERFRRLRHWEAEDMAGVNQAVAEIIAAVRRDGDAAVAACTARFDRLDLAPDALEFSPAQRREIAARVTPGERKALENAALRIRAYHQWQMPALGPRLYYDHTGTLLGQRVNALARVGLYVPGGRASYPSSVLMNAIPARVAGVGELVMVVPTPEGVVNPLLLAAAEIAGVDRVFRIGGAQAVAALAYGTATVPAVDKIVGPGNIYVTAAKKQVFGRVGIDMVAGPSEILVIADGDNDPAWIAADLLSQAEHDPLAQALLITDAPAFADAVAAAIQRYLQTLERREICRQSLERRGALILVRHLEEAAQLANQVAPEHLELAVANPELLLPRIHNAGAIFLGRHTPEALGDYVAGPSHVLPTGGTARFSSPLGVEDFLKRTSIIGVSAHGVRVMGPFAAALARGEGLTAHQLSVELRLEEE